MWLPPENARSETRDKRHSDDLTSAQQDSSALGDLSQACRYGRFTQPLNLYGWPLALGLVVSIYIYEMGHVAMLRQLGIAAGAPLFIPGGGAPVMLKQHVDDPITDSKIGLAGRVWGLAAALAALGVYATTRAPIWLAIAHLTGFLNLFNLIPVWQLDGSRGFHVLSRMERWIVVATIAAMLWVTGQRLLFIVGGVAVWRAAQKQVGAGDRRVLTTFVVLVVALSWIAKAVG
jgi:Zn-dependent protease